MTTFDRAVENGARAIHEAWQQDWDALPDVVKKAAKKSARAAIIAALKELREPSKTMLDAYADAMPGVCVAPSAQDTIAKIHWAAMLDALIKEADHA